MPDYTGMSKDHRYPNFYALLTKRFDVWAIRVRIGNDSSDFKPKLTPFWCLITVRK